MSSCPHAREPTPPGVDLDEAREWLETHARHAHLDAVAVERRWTSIKDQVAATGWYRHTKQELVWGARLAWRHSVRCIGRARWKSLHVRDARAVRGVDGVAEELAEHLRFATNGGRIRSTITVFAHDGDARIRVHNEQLIRYAGYRAEDGTFIGDPRHADFSETLTRRGWRPPEPRGRFDVLPWLIEADDETRIVPVPQDAVLEVAITHPFLPWFADLGLTWHAVPAISNMRLRIGGIDYPCAPFNGFYLVDEIATRNFGDADRYDELPRIARAMGFDTAREDTFWRMRAAVELNTAVLHSFRAAGVQMAEPVAESALFAEFVRREEAAGRVVHGDWSWINGHLGSGFGQSWHRYYEAGEPNPNFWPADPDEAPAG